MSETTLYVNKTGFEMFDIFRAYGLGYLIQGISSDNVEVTITDMASSFHIKVENELPEIPDPQLFVDDERWRYVFSTVRDRKDAKKNPPKLEVCEIIQKNYTSIISQHKNPTYFPKIGKGFPGGHTFYQSLDISASKGIREEKKGSTYNEGIQLDIEEFPWAVGSLGSVLTATWSYGDDYKLTLVPNPSNITLVSHRQIQEELKKEEKKLCRVSSSTSIANYAARLAENLSRKKGLIKYDSIYFNVEKKTGKQNKPGGGGKLSLDILFSIADEEYGQEALTKFDNIFRSGFVKGIKQSLAISLADFIIHPTTDNFRRCVNLNIRGNINENVPLWDKRELEAVLKHVYAV